MTLFSRVDFFKFIQNVMEGAGSVGSSPDEIARVSLTNDSSVAEALDEQSRGQRESERQDRAFVRTAARVY